MASATVFALLGKPVGGTQVFWAEGPRDYCCRAALTFCGFASVLRNAKFTQPRLPQANSGVTTWP